MARPARPWFYAGKNTWYVWLESKKVSLGMRGEETEADAIKAWHKLMANGRAKPEPKVEAVSVGELIEAFLEDAESRLKPATARCYRDLLTPFSKRFQKVMAEAVTTAQAEEVSRRPGWRSSTRHDFLSALSVAFRWAERMGLLDSNPLQHLRKPPMESRATKPLSDPKTILASTKPPLLTSSRSFNSCS